MQLYTSQPKLQTARLETPAAPRVAPENMASAGAFAARGAVRPAPAAPLRHTRRAPRAAARAAPRAALGGVLLEVRGLEAKVAATGEAILKGVDLTLCEGEVHVIMGRNGSGKSTLSKVLVGHPEYEVTGGTAVYKGGDLFALAPEARAHAGLFLSFQVRHLSFPLGNAATSPMPPLDF
jgi:Fe-S cluster assembly ATP-binding protein